MIPESVEVDGVTYVRAYPVAKGFCPCCGAGPRQWTPASVIAAMQRSARDGEAPKVEDWYTSTPDHPNFRMVYRMFGGWGKLVEAAGFAPRARGYWTRDRIIEAMVAWNAKTGEAPTDNTWSRATPEHPASQTVKRVFGSWNEALDRAGFYRRGPYGSRLRAVRPTNEPIGLVNAAPIAEVLQIELATRDLETVAAEIGVDSTYISRIARGLTKTIRADYADRILTALDHPHLLEAARSAA